MAKDIFDTILEKNYHQLTENELTELAEYCQNEQDFMAMKQVLAHSKTVADGPKLSPKEATKEKLDNLFDSTHGKSRKFVPFYLNPLFQIAAVVAVGFAVWMFLQKTENIAPEQLAKNTVEEVKSEAPTTKLSENNSEKINSVVEFDTKLEENKADAKAKKEVPEDDSKLAKNSQHPQRAWEEQYLDVATNPIAIEKDASDDIATFKKETNSKSRVSAPSLSVNDISVESTKKPASQVVNSMNVGEQKNVLNYLAARY